MNDVKKRYARVTGVAGAIIALSALGVTGTAQAAPTRAAVKTAPIKATASSTTQDACSVHKTLGYACNTYIYSSNAAGTRLVRPSVCFHQNTTTTRRTVVTLISYGARGYGANKTWSPASAIAEPGQFWRATYCIDVFTSWALRSPGAWVNTEVSDGVVVETFTTYSPA